MVCSARVRASSALAEFLDAFEEAREYTNTKNF
jgi:hypothetical protein